MGNKENIQNKIKSEEAMFLKTLSAGEKRLKELREGDEIIYIHNEINRIYEVTKNKIIKDTDIDVLENTEENILTLITCVENEPNYRRCVQAEEKDLKYNY